MTSGLLVICSEPDRTRMLQVRPHFRLAIKRFAVLYTKPTS